VPWEAFIQGIESDSFGNLYVSSGASVLKMDALTREFEPWLGMPDERSVKVGHRRVARLKEAYGLRFVRSSNFSEMLVCDWAGEYILLVKDDQVEFFAGCGEGGQVDGPKLEASFSGPYDIQEAAIDGMFIINDWGNHQIRAITPDGYVTTLSTFFNYPRGLTASPFGQIYICDSGTSTIKEVSLGNYKDGEFESVEVKIIAGSVRGGATDNSVPAASASFQYPTGIVYTERGLVIADHSNNMMRLLDLSDPELHITPIADNFAVPSPSVNFHTPYCNFVCLTPLGDLCWTEENERNIRIIPGFARPAERPSFPKFWNLLLDPSSTLIGDRSPICLKSDTSIKVSNSERSFPLHSLILSLVCHPHLQPKTESINSFLESCLDGLGDKAIEMTLRMIYGATAYHVEDLLPKGPFDRAMFLAKVSRSLKQFCGDTADNLLTFFVPAAQTLCSSDVSGLWLVLAELLASHSPQESKWVISVCRILSVHQLGEHLVHGKSLSESEHYHQVLQMITTPSAIPTWNISVIAQFPIEAFQVGLTTLVSHLSLQPINSLQTALKSRNESDPLVPNFIVCVGGSKMGVPVHDWLLYCRWPYFKRMIDSGMLEAENHTAELPSDCTSDEVLLAVLNFIYTSQEPQGDQKEQILALMAEHGAMMEFSDLQDQPYPGFEPLFPHSKK
jgi:hypothetical protein